MIYHSTGGAVWTRRQSWAQFDTSLAQWEGVTMDMTCFGVNGNQGLSKYQNCRVPRPTETWVVV